MDLTNTLSQEGESKGGVLAHLERLETRSRKKLEEPQGAQAVEGALGSKIRQLRSLRDKLRAEVKQLQARVEASEKPDQTLEVDKQVLERKWENMKAILQAYRFTGLSGKLTSRGVCVCIQTAFEGNLLDCYFVDLVIQKPLRIHHHSIPVFIPLEEISAKYLQTNIQHFLFSLCEYLNAYSGRKYQADRLQSDFAAFLAGPLQRNSLCNLLSFTYKMELSDQAFPFCARLLYKDLTVTLPTDVTVTYQGTDTLSTSWEEQQAIHEHLFCTKPLHQVFASFARREERELTVVSQLWKNMVRSLRITQLLREEADLPCSWLRPRWLCACLPRALLCVPFLLTPTALDLLALALAEECVQARFTDLSSWPGPAVSVPIPLWPSQIGVITTQDPELYSGLTHFKMVTF